VISAEKRDRIKADVEAFPPLEDDQRNAVASLATSKDEADAA
jgi:hypothetical protein